MEIGSMRHRITIESLAVAVDASTGALSETWSTYASGVPAAVLPISGSELLRADAGTAGARYRFVIRYGNATGVTAAMRISHENKYFNIIEVIPDSTLRHHWTLVAEAGVRNG